MGRLSAPASTAISVPVHSSASSSAPLPELRRRPCSQLAADGFPPLLALPRQRLSRASRILSHLALLPGAGRLPVNVGWRHPRPVAANDRLSVKTRRAAEIDGRR